MTPNSSNLNNPGSQAAQTLISFDPGSAQTAYCILRGNKHTQHYVSSGTIPSTLEHARAFLNANPADAYAVEICGRFAPNPKIMLSLLKTSEFAGVLIGLAFATGKPVFTLPANAPRGRTSWRVLLCGRQAGEVAGDATVKQYLARSLNMPKVSNNHARDAAGLGVVALRCDLKVSILEFADSNHPNPGKTPSSTPSTFTRRVNEALAAQRNNS